jgi:hypothetical protein
LVGAAGGMVFAVLVSVGVAIAPGPESARGSDVVEYYAAHETETLWQAILIGFAFLFFVWYAALLAGQVEPGAAVLVTSAVTAALYLVAIGAWESLGETYGGVDTVGVSNESYGDAHALYDVGVGAAHFANFAVAGFVGASAAALLVFGKRTLGAIGVTLGAILLLNAPLQLAADSDWSDAVGFVAFGAFLAWVFASSLALVLARRQELSRGGNELQAARRITE